MDYRFEGIVTALSSISHIGETHGIYAKLRREKLVTPNGIEEVPVISGNSARGQLRDLGMLYMCRQLGYGVDPDAGEVQGLTLPAFHFLFGGGTLTKVGDRVLNVAAARELRRLIPLVSVFGGALGNHIMEGKLTVGKLYPLCQETSDIVPARFAREDVSVWDLLQEEAYVRRDDSKSERLRPMLAAAAVALLEAETVKRQAKSQDKDAVDTEVGQHQQMRHYVETFAAGCGFYWEVILTDASDLEFAAFLSALVVWSQYPHLGGMRGVGLGKVAVDFEWCSLDPRLTVVSQALAKPAGTVYQDHLAANGQRIREVLDAVA